MNIEEIRTLALSLPGSTEDFPFNKTTLVFKVWGKMFALMSLDSSPLRINLKCEPEKALELRERYRSVLPGYHMSKKHWNTILIDGAVEKELVTEWLKDSYQLVVDSLPVKIQKELGADE